MRDRQAGTTTLVSVRAGGGGTSSGRSEYPAISADGRHVAFASNGDDIVDQDTNDSYDVFVRNVQAGTTTLVNRASDGTQGNSAAYYPSLSRDGRYVAFAGDSDNLVPGDTNQNSDIFLRDLQSGTTTRINVSSTGDQADDYSETVSLSENGSLAYFTSYSSNLVSNDANGTQDVFLYGPPYAKSTVQFNPSSYSVSEDGGSATITICTNQMGCAALTTYKSTGGVWYSSAWGQAPGTTAPHTYVRSVVDGSVVVR